MSYIVLHDRIKETSRTIGTGPFELEGAVAGFSSFGSVYSNGDNVFYAIIDVTDYEVGSGIYSTGVQNQLTRFPKASTNSNNLVDFDTGTKEVYVTYPATNSVFHLSGLADTESPQSSGIAFWLSENAIGYNSNFLIDNSNNRIGIRTSYPDHTIDIGGYGADSSVKASGFLVGNSGVYFPSGNNGDLGYGGGRQLVHFEPNDVLDVDTQASIGYSGGVSQFIYFKEQAKGFVLAGPPSGCAGECSPATPSFRPLTIDDIPDLDSIYASDTQLATASGALRLGIDSVSGALDLNIDSVSGVLDVISGVALLNEDNIVVVSGMIDVVSGVATSNDTNIPIVSGMAEVASGMVITSSGGFALDISSLSGIIDDVSGIAVFDADVSGILRNDLTIVSGIANSDLDVSGIFRDEVVTLSGIIDEVSGIATFDADVSGILRNDITLISGIAEFASGNTISNATDISTVSGVADIGIASASGTAIAVSGAAYFDRLTVDLDDGVNALIKREGFNQATHLKISNQDGIGSRLLMETLSGSGNTWGLISLTDGAARLYNYTADIDTEVSGILTGTNQIILDSGSAWREFLPLNLSGVYVSGSFLNGGDPDGVRIIYQHPMSGHILSLESTPSTASLPAPVSLISVGRNGMSINSSGDVGFDLDPQSITSKIDIRGDSIRIRNSGVVPTSSSNGYKGEIRWDDSYLYVCTANNSWKRVALDGTPWS